MTLVVDASVGLKWFSEERGTEAALALVQGSESLIAPDLIVPEVCNGAWRLVRQNIMREEQLESIARTLATTLEEILPTAAFAQRALAIARSLDHPVYDCFYLALAEAYDACMVTYDVRLARRTRDTAWAARVTPLNGAGGR